LLGLTGKQSNTHFCWRPTAKQMKLPTELRAAYHALRARTPSLKHPTVKIPVYTQTWVEFVPVHSISNLPICLIYLR